MKKAKYSKIGLGFGIALSGALMGCVHAPPQRVVYSEPPPYYAAPQVVVQDYYVYYPSYQVYYSSYRRQYVYQDGRAWVSRPAPPRVPVDVLFASPSVRLDFHDSPSTHHSRVVKQYPTNWAPPGKGPHNRPGDREYIRDNDRGHR